MYGINDARKVFCSKHELFHPSNEKCTYCDVPDLAKKPKSMEVSLHVTKPDTSHPLGFYVGQRVRSTIRGDGTVVHIGHRDGYAITDSVWFLPDDISQRHTATRDGAVFSVDGTSLEKLD